MPISAAYCRASICHIPSCYSLKIECSPLEESKKGIAQIMKTESLNYEEKILVPTKELYQQLSQQASALFEQMSTSTAELHASISETSLEFYNHPTETSLRWKSELSNKTNELYAYVNNDVIPAAKMDYQHLLNTATDYSLQTKNAIQFFIDNPKLLTQEAFTAINQSVILFLDQSKITFTQVIQDINSQANEIIQFLTDQPLQGIENIYYDSLAGLLNGYFEIVSSLLVTV